MKPRHCDLLLALCIILATLVLWHIASQPEEAWKPSDATAEQLYQAAHEMAERSLR